MLGGDNLFVGLRLCTYTWLDDHILFLLPFFYTWYCCFVLVTTSLQVSADAVWIRLRQARTPPILPPTRLREASEGCGHCFGVCLELC